MLDNQYELQITHFPNTNLRGLVITQHSYNPNTLTLKEKFFPAKPLIIEALWQTLNYTPTIKTQTINKNVISSTSFNFTKKIDGVYITLDIEQHGAKTFSQPDFFLAELFDSLTINPLSYLIKNHTFQQQDNHALQELLYTNNSKENYPLSHFSVIDGLLAYNGNYFQSSNQIEKINFSTASAILLNPNKSIIRISNWALLKPKYLNEINHIAELAGLQTWITTDPESTKELAIKA